MSHLFDFPFNSVGITQKHQVKIPIVELLKTSRNCHTNWNKIVWAPKYDRGNSAALEIHDKMMTFDEKQFLRQEWKVSKYGKKLTSSLNAPPSHNAHLTCPLDCTISSVGLGSNEGREDGCIDIEGLVVDKREGCADDDGCDDRRVDGENVGCIDADCRDDAVGEIDRVVPDFLRTKQIGKFLALQSASSSSGGAMTNLGPDLTEWSRKDCFVVATCVRIETGI